MHTQEVKQAGSPTVYTTADNATISFSATYLFFSIVHFTKNVRKL